MAKAKRETGKNHIKKKKDGRVTNTKCRIRYYMAEGLVIAIVVIAALFLPQIIFRVQDDILCNDTVLGQKESMDVESLSTAYERSLTARMRNLAEGL